MTPELPITLASTDRVLAAALLAMVVIVVASGSLALMMVARSRLRRGLEKKERKSRSIPDAWAESGRRMAVPPGEGTPGDGTDNPGDGPNDDSDDDDDDGDEPRPVVPSSPAISAGM